MVTAGDFRKGLTIEIDDQVWVIVDFQHVKPGKGGAFIRTKLKNMINGRVVENTFRSGEKMVKPDLESKEMQYLYRESEDFVFMDMESYEQLHAGVAQLGEKGGYLKDGMELKMLLYKGQPLDIDLPASVVLEVSETEPGVKGDTVSGATKPAVMESGITVNVPLFINIGDRIKVDTRSGEYIGRE